MKNILYILFLAPILAFNQGTITLTDSDIKAFPTAMGHGKSTTGGRGQTVYRVTTLNNSGTGSLRDALSSSNRIIVFTIGGTITLTSQLTNTAVSNITIAGQTAPGDGIAVHGYGVNFREASNYIIRHMRFRPGDDCDGTDNDALRILRTSGTGSYGDFMIDHCSFSWGDDENLAIETGTSGNQSFSNFTVQNSILSEPFQPKNMILYGKNITNISMIRNLYANAGARNYRASSTPNVEAEFIDNVVYYYEDAIRPTVQHEFDIVGNVFEDGGATQNFETIRMENCSSSNCPPSGETDATGTKAYISDNTFNGGAATVSSNITAYLQGSRNNPSEYTSMGNSLVKDSVLANAGARMKLTDGLDALDLHMIADVTNGSSGGFATAESGTTGLPTLAGGTAYTDTDSDGLSDDYETDQGGSTTSISANARPATAVIGNGNTVDQSGVTSYASQGYTHLDIFLADLAGDWDSFASAPGGGPPAQGNESILKPHRIRFSNSTGAVYFGTTKIKG